MDASVKLATYLTFIRHAFAVVGFVMYECTRLYVHVVNLKTLVLSHILFKFAVYGKKQESLLL